MNWKPGLLVLFTVVVLSGCATMPIGPTVSVMPSPGKPYEVFMADDGVCREWAQHQIGGTSPSQTANENLAAGAVVGTMVGAGLGALIGAATGNAGAGAAIGAGAGLLGGTSIGANEGAASAYQLQRRYDLAYQQCMYSKGNQIPVSYADRRRPTHPRPRQIILHLRPPEVRPHHRQQAKDRAVGCLSIPARVKVKSNRPRIITPATIGRLVRQASIHHSHLPADPMRRPPKRTRIINGRSVPALMAGGIP